MVGIAFLLGLAIGLRCGWHAHTAHGWGKRMMVHVRHLFPAVILASKALGLLAIVGIFVYGWLVH